NKGPNYTFSIDSNVKRMFARTSISNVPKIGLKEAVLDPGPIINQNMIAKFTSLSLGVASKAKRSIPSIRVRVPNNFLYRPYQWVTVNTRDIQQDLQVQRAKYTVTTLANDAGVGCNWCELTLGGSYNPLILNTSCDVL